jgi:hypothetical protein
MSVLTFKVKINYLEKLKLHYLEVSSEVLERFENKN